MFVGLYYVFWHQAKMTREFQQAMGQEGARIVLSNYEKCVLKELQKNEQDQVDQQDLVLKCQVEVKTHVNICKEQKKALNDDFNAFCEAKYHGWWSGVVGRNAAGELSWLWGWG